MNFNEIVLGESKALITEIIDGIQEIAIRLNQNNQYIIRRNLVRELNELIPELNLTDGLIVKSLVKEAYIQTNSPSIQNAISECFYENTGNKLVYDPNRISDVSLRITDPGDDSFGLNEFYQKTEILDRNVQKLCEIDPVAEINETTNAIDLYVAEDNFSLTGKTKVNDTFNYGKKVFEGYGNLINQYESAKQKTLEQIEDFELIRTELGYFRVEISRLLIDIVGNDIIESDPDLFDFSEIEYFDIEKFRGKVELAFEGIGSNLMIFKTAYDENMLNVENAAWARADNAMDRLSETKKRKGHVSRGEVKGQVATAVLGFAFDAALEIIETRKNAEETVALIKKDVELMKLCLKGDAQKIATDLLRLSTIHNRLKVTLIPEAIRFIDNANIIFNSTIKDVYSEIVSGGTIKELSNENRNLVAETNQINLEIEDKKLGIKICEDEISMYKDLISEIQYEYDYVYDIKPIIPNSFHNIISLGTAKINYEQHLAEWKRITEPVRMNYEFYFDSRNLEEENIIGCNDIILKLKNRLEEIEKLRECNNVEIEAQRIKIEDFEPQLEILENKIKQISAASRNLLERRIDKDLIKIPGQTLSNGIISIDDLTIINASSVPALTKDDIAYLSNKKYEMDLKIEIMGVAESLFTGELIKKIANLAGGNKEIFIADQMIKVKTHLSSKIYQNTQLNHEQANRLVELGANILVSILKTQKVNAQTNYLMDLNSRIDQEFLKQFESSVASLKLSIEKDHHEANAMESALTEAMSAEDLLRASELIKNN